MKYLEEQLKEKNGNIDLIVQEILDNIDAVYVTGDTHGNIDDIEQRFYFEIISSFIKIDLNKKFKDEKECSKLFETFREIREKVWDKIHQKNKNDIIIMVSGDFGLFWNNTLEIREKTLINKIKEMPFTICWVDGNHDNHDYIDKLPVSKWCGGKVHKITDNCYHLMRGEVFEIKGKKWFCFGGAASHDIQDGIIDGNNPEWKEIAQEWAREGKWLFRVKGISWWEREMPSEEEYQNGLNNLDKNDWKVDYVLTHACPTTINLEIINNSFEIRIGKELDINKQTDYFEKIMNKLQYHCWYSGHLHQNECKMKGENKYNIVLYEKMIKVE